MKQLFILALILLPCTRATAQIELIEDAVKAAIEAVDLGVKKIQTETIWLQDAQRMADNLMQQTDLDEIQGWVSAHRDLYAGWLQQLWQVRSALLTYQLVRKIIEKESLLLRNAQQATATFQKDPHFSPAELNTISLACNQLLQASIEDIGQLTTVITSLTTQMDDGTRLRTIDQVGAHIDQQSAVLKTYTEQNLLLSLQRAKDQSDLETIKALYGL